MTLQMLHRRVVFAANTARKSRKLVFCVMLLVASRMPASVRAEEVAPSLYVRTDSDHTTVISPRVRARAPVTEATNVDVVYTADIWTSASIDVVASASEPVTEQRDEIDVGVDHALMDVTLSGGYRYSHEPDFVSHGGSLGISMDFADKSTTIAARIGLSADQVGRAGDPMFWRDASTLSLQTAFTQVLDRETIAQLLYDFGRTEGYQSSPYRYVAIGGQGSCRAPGSWCRPERNPELRMRHAWALRGRRALSARFSLGAGYRFYLDDWGLTSHTVTAGLTWVAARTSTLSLQYRGYRQSAADHYKARYEDPSALNSFFTGDKELSPLWSQRVMLELEQRIELPSDTALRAGVAIGPTWYRYLDYVYLTSMVALDVTATAVLEF